MKIRGSWYFGIQWATLRYLVVCLVALAGMLFGSLVLQDMEVALILAFAGYIGARILLWVLYKE